MKKLMGMLSVACLCGWLVGCAAEEATDVDAPVVTPSTEDGMPPMTDDPAMTTEDPAAITEDPAATTEDPAATDEPTIPGEISDEPAIEEEAVEDPDATTEEPAETTEEPAAP